VSEARKGLEPKPTKTRQAELEDRKRASGLRRVCVWAHPDDAKPIRAYAAKMAAKRAKEKKRD
jgi:hypothetical protein